MECERSRILAFCLFKYFPHGGLQRDMLRLALACQLRGYTIDVYTTSWRGDVPPSVQLHLHRPRALTNHGRVKQYHAWVAQQLAGKLVDCVIGFNKMPDLDIYYDADGCYQARVFAQHGRLYRLLPRYRLYQAFEEAVFGKDSKTHILMLSQTQETLYLRHYGTPTERIHRLPPNVAKDRSAGPDAPEIRRAFRQTLGVAENDRLLLQLGSGFRTKGLDRSILALAHLPRTLLAKTWLCVAGRGVPHPYVRLARRLGVADRVIFLGPRDDVPRLLVSADLLVHPAYHENTGTVLLEALACGLAVVASGVCGYAHYVAQAEAGWVLPEPFDQDRFNHSVQAALERSDLREIGRRGVDFTRRENLHGTVETAVAIIEAVAHRIVT